MTGMRRIGSKIMKARTGLGVSTLAVCGLLLTACTQHQGGTPSTTASSATSSAFDNGDAPPIPEPQLDATKYMNDPCRLLQPTQLSQVGVHGQSSSKKANGGVKCEWFSADDPHAPHLFVSIISGSDTEGLKTLYANKEQYPSFEAMQVAGYPGLHLNDTKNLSQGRCESAAGVKNKVAISTSIYINDRESAEYKKPCAVSDKVDEMIIQNLKGGN